MPGRKSHFIVSFALILAVVVGVLAGPARAEASAPKLRARTRSDDTIRLSWSSVRATSDSVTVIEIERGDTATATSALVSVPARPRNYDDRLATPGVYWYRARVVTDGQPSPWSGAVSAGVQQAPTPAPTPAGGQDDVPLGPGQRECVAGTIDATLALVNDARQAANAPALRDDPDLRWAARVRAIAIATSQQLSHDGWVAAIQDSGYRYSVAAENIASGYWSPSSVVQGWLASPDHRANIVSHAYRDTGIGCVIDTNGKLWWAEDFGG